MTINELPILMAGTTKYRRKFPALVKMIEGSNLSTKLYSCKEYKQGEEIVLLKELKVSEIKDYTTVQIGQNKHIDLDCEFVFANHSCNPSVNFVVKGNDISIVASRNIHPSMELTFFYPSTEWEMDQPFDCWCGDVKCFKRINGAKFLNKEHLSHLFINQHIQDLL